MNQANTIISSYIVKTREVEYLKRQYIEKLDQLEKLENLYLQTINQHEKGFSTTKSENLSSKASSIKVEKEIVRCSNCDHELFCLNKSTLNSEKKDDYLILFPKLKPKIDSTKNVQTINEVIKSEPITIDLNDIKIRKAIGKKSKIFEYMSNKGEKKGLSSSSVDHTKHDTQNLNRNPRSKKICSYCGENGHKRAQCYKRLNSERGI